MLRAGTATQVVHRIRFTGFRANLNNEATVTWNVAKTRTWSATSDVYTESTEGDTTIAGTDHVGVWGITRRNLPFQTQFVQPMVANSSCGFGQPTAGVKLHKGWSRQVLVTFGVDAQGSQVTAPNCAYGYKVEFTNAHGHQTRIMAY